MQRQFKERSTLENKLRKEVNRYFTQLEKKVLTTYKKAAEQGIPPHNIQTLILILIQSWHQEYTPTILKYHLLVRKLAQKQNNELITLQQRKTLGLRKSRETLTLNPVLQLEDNPLNLISTKAQTTLDPILPEEQHYRIEENKIVTKQIEQANFKFCEKTRARVTDEINSIIAHSETEGIGPYQVAEQLQNKFGQLKTYEANRIARTEINRADNTYRYDDIMNNDLIDYIQWYGHNDGKERDSHIALNGKIIRKGELFSNGLRHPGDPNGPAKEVINCRCTIVPWIPPFDKMPPTGMTEFTEADLIDKPADAGQQFLLETLENTRIYTPTSGGMNISLDNIKVSRVNDALTTAATATLAGDIKTKEQLQSTLDKLLDISKKPTKKPIQKPEIIKPTDTKEIQELKQTVNELTEQIEQNTYKYKFTPEEQEIHDQLMDKFLESGGLLNLKKGKPVLKGGNLTTKEKEQLTKLHEKKLSILSKPTQPKTTQFNSPLTLTEQKEYVSLMEELINNEGTLKVTENGNIMITGMPPTKQKILKKLYKKQNNITATSNNNTHTTTTNNIHQHTAPTTHNNTTSHNSNNPVQVHNTSTNTSGATTNNNQSTTKLIPDNTTEQRLTKTQLKEKNEALTDELRRRNLNPQNFTLDLNEEELQIIEHAIENDLIIPNKKGIITRKQIKDTIEKLKDLDQRGYKKREVQIDLQDGKIAATRYQKDTRAYKKHAKETNTDWSKRPDYDPGDPEYMGEVLHEVSPEDKFIAYYTYGPSSTINKYRRVTSEIERQEVIKEAARKILRHEPKMGYSFYRDYYGESIVNNWTEEEWIRHLTRDINKWLRKEPSMLKDIGEDTIRHHLQKKIYDSDANILNQIEDILNGNIDLDNVPEEDLIGEWKANTSLSFTEIEGNSNFGRKHFEVYVEQDGQVVPINDLSVYPGEMEDLLGGDYMYKVFKVEPGDPQLHHDINIGIKLFRRGD